MAVESSIAPDRDQVATGVAPALTASQWTSVPPVTVTLRPMAGPSSLGLFGLAAASVVLSGLQLGWVPIAASGQVAVVLIAFAFPAQATTGVFAFLTRDGATATVMSVLALSWLATGVVMLTSPPGSRSEVLGLFLVVVAVAVALTGLTAAMSKLVMGAVLLTASARFLLTALFHLTGDDGWKSASGLLGLALAGLAVYAAWAFELEDAAGRTMLPTGRRSKGLVALHGSLDEQVRDVSAEPGVRCRL